MDENNIECRFIAAITQANHRYWPIVTHQIFGRTETTVYTQNGFADVDAAWEFAQYFAIEEARRFEEIVHRWLEEHWMRDYPQ